MSDTSTSTPPPPPEGGGGDDGQRLVRPPSRPVDPIAALLLNLLVLGGTGYLLIGQKNKGIVMIVIWLAVGIPTCFSASYAISILSAMDVYMQATHLAAGRAIGPWTFFHNYRNLSV